MHRIVGSATLATALLTATPAVAGPNGWATASDAGRNALVAAALGVPTVMADWRGGLEAGGSMLATSGATWALKEVIHERRPDGSDDRSFPSGHASVSFAAAITLEKRYGWQVGVPALAVATFVSASRVAANKHDVSDVLAGAAIGSAAGWLLTSRRDDRVKLVPWAVKRGGGLSVSARW